MASNLEHQDLLTLGPSSSSEAVQVPEEFQPHPNSPPTLQHALGWVRNLILTERRFNEISEPHFLILRVELKSARATSRSIKEPTTITY